MIWTKRGEKAMAKIYITNDPNTSTSEQDITAALRKFKRKVSKDGTLTELRKREYFMSRKEKRVFKQKEARKFKK